MSLDELLYYGIVKESKDGFKKLLVEHHYFSENFKLMIIGTNYNSFSLFFLNVLIAQKINRISK